MDLTFKKRSLVKDQGGPCLYSQHYGRLRQEDCKCKPSVGKWETWWDAVSKEQKRAGDIARYEGPGYNPWCILYLSLPLKPHGNRERIWESTDNEIKANRDLLTCTEWQNYTFTDYLDLISIFYPVQYIHLETSFIIKDTENFYKWK